MINTKKHVVNATSGSAATLSEFLKEMKAPNDPAHTHVSMGTPRGVYAFGSKMKDFWAIYNNALSQKRPMYLAENPGKETPILVDIDLRVKKSILSDDDVRRPHLYKDEQVKEVVSAYQQAIHEVVDFSDVDADKRDTAFTCVLLEKKPYETEIGGEKYIKNGFHLHFPKLFLDKKAQEVYVIPKVKERINGLFDNIGAKDFLDTNSINVHWLLYGSRKQNNTPYKATKCFLKDMKEVSLEEGLSDYVCSRYPGESPDDIDCAGNVKQMLPRILSIFLYDRGDNYIYNPKPSVTTPLMKTFEMVKTKRKQYDNDSVEKQLQEAQQLISMMNSSRADDYSTWLRVGYCLWQISEGDNDGFSMWLAFSDQSDKFDESECLLIWQKMRSNNYTIGTLKYYAKQDSPDKYEKMIDEKTHHLVIEAVNGCHNDVAKILNNEYGNEFVCTSISNKEWYQYKDHIWKPLDKGTKLRERISDDNGIIIKQLKNKRHDVYSTLEDLEQNDPEKKDCEKQLKKMNDLIRQCKATPFKNHVMVESQEVFYNPDFYNLLNKNPYLVAFKNGVYDFENDIFRDGNPEDYISVALPIEYVDYGSVDHLDVIEVDEYFQKVFPDREVRDYFLDQACHVFVGGNHHKVILFWTGDGNNGKTVTQTLFEKMLGKLAVKFSTSLLTGKKANLGSANPEMARAGEGVRWAVMDEPNADEMISSGTLKGLTGNDSYWARDLFQKGKETKEIQPMFKLHMICNKLPAIKDADKATWNRIRVIPFESTFKVENECPQDFEEQIRQKVFPMDKNFTDKIPRMTQPLAWYLIQRWRTIRKLEPVEPEKVKVATDMYRQENDIYKQFEQQCVFVKRESRLTPATLYSHFKEWFREECPNHITPTRSAVRQHFVTQWGDLEKGKYWANKTCRQSPVEVEVDSDSDSDSGNDEGTVNPFL
jgi:P4 family phage/plasmid primase-like protien